MPRIDIHNLPSEIGGKELLELVRQYVEASDVEIDRLETKIEELEREVKR